MVAMKILLNRSPVMPKILPNNETNSVELALVTADLKEIDPSSNEVMAKYLLDTVQFIYELKGISKTTKQNRINFFSETV